MIGIPTYITPLSYIRGSGTQYITTDIHLNSNDVVKSKWRFEASAGNVYGCFTGSGEDDNFCLYAGSQSTDAYIRYNGQLVRDFRATSGTIYELEQGPDGFFANGTKLCDFNSASFTCSAPMYIFMLPNSSSAKVTARCYGLTVLRNGAIAYNFIPARNEKMSEVGMWESVNGIWYSSVGTGDFSEGELVYAPNKLMMLKRRKSMASAALSGRILLPDEALYFTFQSTIDGNEIYFTQDVGNDTFEIEISTDGNNWSTKVANHEETPLITLNAGEKVFLRGYNPAYTTVDNNGNITNHVAFWSWNTYYVYGNIMSLVDGDNALRGVYSQLSPYAFYDLFEYEDNFFLSGTVLSHPERNIILPATSLAPYCYGRLFSGSGITRPPELPATTMAEFCYSEMFKGSKITVTPELPALSLAKGCYQEMFSASKITATPSILPATTLAEGCYSSMFSGHMDTLVTVPSGLLPATTLAKGCYDSMFFGASRIVSAPDLPASVLTERCYYEMFMQCTSLTSIKCMATDISANNCVSYWLGSVSATGTFVKNPNMSSWPESASGIPTGWTVVDATD